MGNYNKVTVGEGEEQLSGCYTDEVKEKLWQFHGIDVEKELSEALAQELEKEKENE